LEGHYGRDLRFLEGRFAPKKTPTKTLDLLRRIIGDFHEFQRQIPTQKNVRTPLIPAPTPMQLRLVAHFIKKKDTRKKLIKLCRHYHLRRDLDRQTGILIHLKRRRPDVGRYLCGADAAANELHAPPEVFAPIFRRLRRAGWHHFTYHVGEDFHHLLSGIRAIHEAVEFLELSKGNRIGHATAIGIDPRLWLRRMPEKIVIARGEWLDNLVFAFPFLLKEPRFAKHLHQLKQTIEEHARAIYGKMDMTALVTATQWRRWDPLKVFHLEKRSECIDLHERIEWDKPQQVIDPKSEAFRLLQIYHCVRDDRKYDEPIEVETGFLPPKVLRYLQDEMIRTLNQKLVAIESMVTSNVRIAPYEDYREHHLFRWLGLTKHKGPKPTVLLASDDPGIFATNLRNEFAHVLKVLVDDKGLEHSEAMDYLRRLNANARDFRFGQDWPLREQPNPFLSR
jgi:adenosine deaminase